MIIWIIGIIAVVSFVLSLLSLRHELRKSQHEEHIKKDLEKSKVLFYSPSEDVSKESS